MVTACAQALEFNVEAVDKSERDNIDWALFSNAGIIPGEYYYRVKINERFMPNELRLSFNKLGDEVYPCFDMGLVRKFGLKSEYLKRLQHVESCIYLNGLDGVDVKPDQSAGVLAISIPQEYMENNVDSWFPGQWDQGVSGILFDYNLNSQVKRISARYSNDFDQQVDISGNGVAGVNLGAWRARANWQGGNKHGRDDSDISSSYFDWTQYYAYRPLIDLKSKLTIGETYYNSDVFESFRFVGAEMESDDNMLPPNLRSYSPEIAGVAKTNAKVRVLQEGRVLYETQVAPGPFRIQDLGDFVNGALDVRVEEQNGEVQQFTVNTSSLPYLTRPGRVRYKVAGGKPEGYNFSNDSDSSFSHDSVDTHRTYEAPVFATGEASYGITDGWSVYGGAIASDSYNALSFGVGRDWLAYGAVALDATESRAKLISIDQDVKSGKMYRFNYSKRFDDYNSDIKFTGSRFTRDFMAMDDYLDAETDYYDDDKDKYVYTVTLNRQFESSGLSMYVNYSHESYWNGLDNNRFNVNVAQSLSLLGLHGVSVSLTAYKNNYRNVEDYGGYLSLSLSLDMNNRLSASASTSNNSSSGDVGYYHRVDANNNYQIRTGAVDSNPTINGYYNHLGDAAEVNTIANYQAGEVTNSASLGVTLRGGLTATENSVALHRVSAMGDSRLMVDTDGVPNVPIKNYSHVSHTNTLGTAVIADLNDYYRSSASIDLPSLDGEVKDVEVVNNFVEASLTEGAIGYREFGIVHGDKSMATVLLSSGEYPPFGAGVYNSQHQQLGMVTDNGRVYLTGLNPEKIISMRWGEGECDIKLPKKLKAVLGNLSLMCTHG